jgi:hypothetical protein
MITERIRLDQINEGFASMATGENPRILIEFEGVGTLGDKEHERR